MGFMIWALGLKEGTPAKSTLHLSSIFWSLLLESELAIPWVAL